MAKYAKLMILLVALLVFAGQLTAKAKMKVQLVGESVVGGSVGTGGYVWHYVYLILPNGGHALGTCIAAVGKLCKVESFAPESRKESKCRVGNPPVNITCYAGEFYEAERKNNDITIYGGAGKVTYHIDGPW